MKTQNIGFAGAGRITRIFLARLTEVGAMPEQVIVFDTDRAASARLAEAFPRVRVAESLRELSDASVIFLSLHPPVVMSALAELAPHLANGSVVVSLAPKVKISAMAGALPAGTGIVRLLPNAPSIVGKGYNPICFAPDSDSELMNQLMEWLSVFGQTISVPEKDIEAYAAIVAMGSTYFWFQWKKLVGLAREFGLSDEEAPRAVREMLSGSVETYFESGLEPDEVIDLVPVKPLAEKESEIEQFYDEKIKAIYSKITN